MLNLFTAEGVMLQHKCFTWDHGRGTGSRGSPSDTHQNTPTAQTWTPASQNTCYSPAGMGNPKPKHFTWLTASLSLFSTYLQRHSVSWQGKEPNRHTHMPGCGSDLQPPSRPPHRTGPFPPRCCDQSSRCLPKTTPPAPINNNQNFDVLRI